MAQFIRASLIYASGAMLMAFVASRTNAFDRWMATDFLEYWASGRLNLRGENPYDPSQLLAEQRIAEPRRDHAVMMWNPPPSLALYMPIGILPAKWASLLWVCLQTGSILLASRLLWQVYACTPGQPQWPAPILAACSAGSWWVIAYGQNTGFILLGLAGFLHFLRKDRPLTAGACAALTALKPHLLAVFGVLLVTDACTRRGARTLAAGIAAIALALGAACLLNPSVMEQFASAVRHPAAGASPLSDWWLPVPAFWLRKWFAPNYFVVQFAPCAIACTCFLGYRFWRRAAWNWSQALPLVIAASVLTTPYGGWLFDLPVLLVPMIWAAARILGAQQWGRFRLFLMGQALVTAASLASPRGLHEYWWVAPATLAICLLGFCRTRRTSDEDPGEDASAIPEAYRARNKAHPLPRVGSSSQSDRFAR
ncbi:MAG TPA: glycosyltransferase family 87 protein [Gemmataceae bacterium]